MDGDFGTWYIWIGGGGEIIPAMDKRSEKFTRGVPRIGGKEKGNFRVRGMYGEKVKRNENPRVLFRMC